MCPDCKEPLIVFELEGIEVDHCLECGGTWLDAGELELLAQLAGGRESASSPRQGDEPGALTRALQQAAGGKRGSRRCPRCRRRMRTIPVGPELLDRCPRGHGFWLDRGEMEAIIRAFADKGALEEGVVARFFSEIYKNELQNKSKGDS